MTQQIVRRLIETVSPKSYVGAMTTGALMWSCLSVLVINVIHGR